MLGLGLGLGLGLVLEVKGKREETVRNAGVMRGVMRKKNEER